MSQPTLDEQLKNLLERNRELELMVDDLTIALGITLRGHCEADVEQHGGLKFAAATLQRAKYRD